MAKKVALHALKIDQPMPEEKTMFLVRIPVKYLVDKTYFDIDYWKPEKKNNDREQGYQRLANETRARKVADYIINDSCPILPTTVLINSRTPIKFIPSTEDDSLGTIVLNDYPLWIIDGQHRVAGLDYLTEKKQLDKWLEYEIPAVVLSNFEKVEEVKQFRTLNTTQKGVATDLAERLNLDLAKKDSGEETKQALQGIDWKNRALIVIDMLNERSDSPWQRSIRLPNSPKLAASIINQTSFLKSLQPLFKDGLLSPIKDAEKSYEVIKNYWLAVKRRFPEAFVKPREYVIQKTPGVFSLHSLAHRMLLIGGRENTSTNYFFGVLDAVFEGYKTDFWRADGDGAALYGSMKGFKLLAMKFEENLPEK